LLQLPYQSSPTTNIVQVVTTASVTATHNLGVNKLRRKIHCTMCGLDGTQCLGAHNKKKCFQLYKKEGNEDGLVAEASESNTRGRSRGRSLETRYVKKAFAHPKPNTL
jgi:hypothetical protein